MIINENNVSVKTITPQSVGYTNNLVAGDTVNNSQQAYAVVPIIYRAIRLRCDSLSGVPVHVYDKKSGKEVDFDKYLKVVNGTLSDVIWRTEASLLMSGGAFWLKNKVGGKTRSIQWINPFYVSVNWVMGGETLFYHYLPNQLGIDEINRVWTTTDVAYFKEFNSIDDIRPGQSTASVALSDTQLIRYMTRFAGRFFESGAMPVTVVHVDGNPSKEEVKAYENFFARLQDGVRNAWKTIVTTKRFTTEVISQNISDLAIKELFDQALHNISLAFGIPLTMLTDAANYATAEEHRKSFWNDTVKPRGKLIQDVINRQVMDELGLRFEFAFDELEVFQADEKVRSASLKALTDSGVPLSVAMDILGYVLTDDQLKLVMKADEVKNTPPVPPQIPVSQPQTPSDEPTLETELAKWQKKAQKRIKDGKSASCEFESDVIPNSLKSAILGALNVAKSLNDIHVAFTDATRWQKYP